MKTINIIRYTGSNHVSLVADKKNNPSLLSTIQATALSPEEAEAQLTSDLSLQVEEEFTLTITDFDRKKFTNLPTEKLLKLYEKTESMLGAKEMMEAILIKRGALSIVEPTEEEENESAEPVKEDPTPVREYKKCMTEECLQARLAEARTNYKKFCKFVCTKDKEEHFGLIRSARLDKRSSFIQYRIEILEKPTENDTIYTQRSGRIYGKGDDSKDLTIYEETLDFIQLSNPAPAEEPAQTEENANVEA